MFWVVPIVLGSIGLLLNYEAYRWRSAQTVAFYVSLALNMCALVFGVVGLVVTTLAS